MTLRNRPAIALAVIGLALVGILAWQVLDPGEPRYQGKALGEWLKDLDYGGGRRYRAATNALHHIGTNALPGLQRYLLYRDAAWKDGLDGLVAKTRLFGIADKESDWHRRAGRACRELGMQASPLLPVLVVAVRDPAASVEITYSLARMLPNSVSALTNLLATGGREARLSAAICLRDAFAHPTTAETAFVALTNALNAKDAMVQHAAISSLARPGPLTNLWMPILFGVSTNLSFHQLVRSVAADELAKAQGQPSPRLPPMPPR